MSNRFVDANYCLADFATNTLVHCPQCNKQATVNKDDNKAGTLRCRHCHYTNHKPPENPTSGLTVDYYFGQELWLQAAFKNELLWFHNYEHLSYVKQYISASIRQRNEREFFTLVEKLPQFIKSGKNRDKLLKMIEKLERK